jgi:3-phenylpropionate/trans-cinnamate dioxygenase ferredoxin reductase subunit
LILATGARERAFHVPGIGLHGVLTLRTLAQARTLKVCLGRAQRVVVVGGGFVGLEFAAAAGALGLEVTVLERARRVLMRALAAETSAFVEDHHRRAGVAFRLDASITGFHGHGSVASVELSDGERLAADLVLVGVGVEAHDHLAREAGLGTRDGILVDAYLRTSDPAIYAIGDCARFPSRFSDGPARIESVQNATDHARCVAANIMGAATPYDSTPWFWSDQGALKLQIAGLGEASDDATIRGATEREEFSVFRFREGALRAVDSINRGAEHVLARRLIASGVAIDRERVADESLPLKALMQRG